MQKSKLKIQIRQPQNKRTIKNTKNKKIIEIPPNKEKRNKQQPIYTTFRMMESKYTGKTGQ